MSRPVVSVVMPFAGDAAAAAAAIETLLALRLASRRRADPRRQLRAARRLDGGDGGGQGRPRDRRALAGACSQRRRRASRTTTGSCSWTPIAWRTTGCSTPTSRCPSPTMSGRWRARCSPRRRATRWLRATARLGASSSQEAHLRHPYRPRAVAANLLVRRAAFEQVGGFYEGVRAGEDTDFSWRLQAAGWRLELRTEASVEHRYRTTLRDLRSQWRGYAAGRAWLARRYDGFEPEPALRRASSRAWRRVRRAPGADRPAARSRELVAARAGRLERGGYALLDALLSAEELAGFALSNRPIRTATRTPAQVVLVADRFPARGDPLVEFAQSLGRRPRRGRGAPGVAGCRGHARTGRRVSGGRRLCGAPGGTRRPGTDASGAVRA